MRGRLRQRADLGKIEQALGIRPGLGEDSRKVRQAGTTVFLEYSTLDVDGRRMQCRARFRGTVSAGSEVFSATLTGNLSPFDDFSAGARTTWNPDLTFQRAARITTTGGTSTDGPRTWGLLGNVPLACSP